MATSPIYNWPEPDNTDLVKNGALAIRTLGNAIDTTMATMVAKTIIDAKGDLIAGTAADTAQRLAVGSNGETLVADSSTSTGLRYTAGTVQANPVLNSAMQNWQRGTSIAVTANNSQYVMDRWYFFNNANQASVVSRQATGDTTNLPNIQYAARMQRNSGQTGVGAIGIAQSFETINSVPFAGKTVTLSFYARAGANFSSASNALSYYLPAGTGTDQNVVYSGYTGRTTPLTATATLTTTWQRFTATGTIASTVTELSTVFEYTPTGTAGANDYFEVTGVQIDIGSVALPFRTYAATIQGELSACMRYYEQSYNVDNAPGTATANGAITGSYNAAAATTGYLGATVVWKVTKRNNPTLTIYDDAGASGKCSRGSLGVANTANQTVASSTATQTAALVYSSGTQSAQAIVFQYTANSEL
jgi:hypothetical protein